MRQFDPFCFHNTEDCKTCLLNKPKGNVQLPQDFLWAMQHIHVDVGIFFQMLLPTSNLSLLKFFQSNFFYFQKAIGSSQVRHVSDALPADPSRPITYKQPGCGYPDIKLMANCPRGSNPCSHTNDVWVKCQQ